MSKCDLSVESQASDGVAKIFQEIREGFNSDEISDYFLLLAHNEAALSTTWETYKQLLINGVVPRKVKEMIYLAVSLSKGCRYCSSSHLALCEMYSVGEESIDSIINSIDTLTPDRMRIIITFAVRVANEPKTLTAEDYEILYGEGLDMAEIVEILSMATFCAAGTQLAQAAGLHVEQSTAEYLRDKNLTIGF